MNRITLTKDNALEVARQISVAFENGHANTVNGRRIRTISGFAAHAWGTGSVSVDVANKKDVGCHQMWIKPGQSVTLTKEA